MSMYDKLMEFETAFGGPINIYVPDHELVELRFTLIDEEVQEAAEELSVLDDLMDHVRLGHLSPDDENIKETKANLTKELADILYVTVGTAVALGLPIQEAFDEVHRSNMSKLGEDGKPILREDGKVLKGPNYTQANIRQFIK